MNFKEWQYKIYKNGYKINRLLFIPIVFLIFTGMFFLAYKNDFKLNYYKCENPTNPNGCHNPFYKAPGWENIEFLEPGEYGVNIDNYLNLFLWGGLGSIGLMFIINHLLYNKGIALFKYEDGGENEEVNNNREE